ncbi:hypothetical protein OQA88_7989 [Cercophora sp. LCS_1]
MPHQETAFTPEWGREDGGNYWARMQTSQREVCPGLISHLASRAKGREAEEGRVAVVVFQHGPSGTIPLAVREFLSSRSLARYLNKTLSEDTTGPLEGKIIIRPRIFVLEGLPRNVIDVLGSGLNIPPALFASHWVTGRCEGAVPNRIPRYYNPTGRYTLRMPRFHRAKVQALGTDVAEPIYRMNTPFRRRLSRATVFGDFDGLLSSTERVSFWARMDGESWDEQYRMSVSNPEGTHAGRGKKSVATTWLDSAWTRPWQSRAFGRLVRARLAPETIATNPRTNVDALGLLGGTSFVSNDSNRSTSMSLMEGWEADAWYSLREALDGCKRRLDILWQAYSEAVAARESIMSNFQGRHVGYLSSLATLFVPVSLVTGIFSMGGEFAPSESHFWVYRAVSVPVMILGCVLLFTRAGRRVMRRILDEEAGL